MGFKLRNGLGPKPFALSVFGGRQKRGGVSAHSVIAKRLRHHAGATF